MNDRSRSVLVMLLALLAMAPDPVDPEGTRADQDEARAELQSIANK